MKIGLFISAVIIIVSSINFNEDMGGEPWIVDIEEY
jgi:hypothetical protein